MPPSWLEVSEYITSQNSSNNNSSNHSNNNNNNEDLQKILRIMMSLDRSQTIPQP